jgi:hypothetical protein
MIEKNFFFNFELKDFINIREFFNLQDRQTSVKNYLKINSLNNN